MAETRTRRIVASVLTLALGAGIGVLFWSLRMPLPWMLGPMIGVTLAALFGVPVRGPARLRPFVVPVIGVLIGSSITSDLLADIGEWGATLAILPLFLATAGASSYLFYRRLGGYDPVTAFFSAMPGGLNDMLIMGVARGGNEKQIAIAHATRILFVISLIVLFFGAVLGVRSGGSGGTNWRPLSGPSPLDWAVLAGCAALGSWGGAKARLAAAPILGPMILSGAAHVSGLVSVAPPSILIVVAQVVIGTVVGSRFVGATAREIGRDLSLGLGSSTLMIIVAVSFAELVHVLTGTDLAQAFLAFSPGGLTEMGLLALAIGQDVAYVSIMHLFRIMIVIFGATPIFALLLRRRG